MRRSDLEFASQLKQQQPQPHEGGGDEAAAAGAGKSGPWSQLLPGAVVTATVHGHEAYGLTMDLEGFPVRPRPHAGLSFQALLAHGLLADQPADPSA